MHDTRHSGCIVCDAEDGVEVSGEPTPRWDAEGRTEGSPAPLLCELKGLIRDPTVGEFPLEMLLGALAEHGSRRLALSVSNESGH